MLHLKPHAWTWLFACLLCASCASDPRSTERVEQVEEDIETILREPLDASDYVEARRCLTAPDYRDFRVLDDRRIVFEGRRGRLWLNTLRMRCPDLRYADVLRVKSISAVGRICDLDTFHAADWFDWPWYRRSPWRWGAGWGTSTSCTLGKFQPVTAAQVAAIEAALESRRGN